MTGVQTCALPICFPVTINGLQGGSGTTISVRYDNNKITLFGGNLTVVEANLNMSQLNGNTLPLSNPGISGRLWNDSGVIRIS